MDLASGAFATYPAGGDSGATFLQFSVNPEGHVSAAFKPFSPGGPTGAVTPSGSTLVFNPVLIEVNPTTYAGTYEVSGYPNLTGKVCINMLPTLAGVVRTLVQQGQIFVEADGVTPSSIPLQTGGSEPDTFLFSLCARPVGPVTVWIGLKNSDDQGTQFDLLAELLDNGTPIASGLTRCITGVTRNPSLAKQVSIAFNPPIAVPPSSLANIAVRFSTRIGTRPDGTKCPGPGGSHNSALGLRLYYDSLNRMSQVAIDDLSDQLFLRSDGAACPAGGPQSPGVTARILDDTAPTATSAKCKDSGTINFAPGNPFSEVGTWSAISP